MCEQTHTATQIYICYDGGDMMMMLVMVMMTIIMMMFNWQHVDQTFSELRVSNQT